MLASPQDTIAAIASAPGPSLRGIIRISGPEVESVLCRLLGNEDWIDRTSRLARRHEILIPIADRTLTLPAHLLYWPTERSFTGERLAEIHLLGSPPLLNEVLGMILTSGARPAERGEFTLRAFLAGRIDLVQAEAVLGVIDAGNSFELRTALAQLAGGISTRMEILREELLLHLADLEAGLDFVEEDIEFVAREELLRRLHSARELLNELLQQSSDRMLTSARLKVVLAGLPNAGKSTLFNWLCGRQSALVSSIAGTTRDYLTAAIRHAGTSFDLVDTAGWERARDEIESAAGNLRTEQLQRADLVIWCSAADLSDEEALQDQALREECEREAAALLHLQTKGDCGSPTGILTVSAERNQGLDLLLNAIAARLSTTPTDTEMIGATAARCQESLQHAIFGIDRAIDSIAAHAGDELIALELREVLEHLGRIVGRVYTDDILDRIFSRFCIGK
ncbi:tRNA modification GTPase [Planctomicrobium sp. SH661]|uniref:tRNA modification GTPase n=1 Tax=Planctomicrobium sp. SH661 TaxID=3448124 RepID=UPI003F5CA808